MTVSAASSATNAAVDLVRVSVAHGGASHDLVLPARLPIAEILPEVASATGILDPYEVHGGYRLLLVDGQTLDPDAGLVAQGVHDGMVLNLVSGADLSRAKVYDDVVEAVADAVEQTGSGWSADASRLTLIAVSGLLLGFAAWVLHLHRGAGIATLVVAALGSVLLLLGGAVFARVVKDRAAALVTLTAGIAFAVLAALAAFPGPVFGTPLLAAGAALLVAGAAATAALPGRSWTFLPAIVLGASAATIGGLVLVTGLPGPRLLAVVVTVAVLLGSLVPWFALASARALPRPMTSEADITSAAADIDPAAVDQRVTMAHQVQLGLSVAIGLLLIVSAPTIVSIGWSGLALIWAAGLALILRSRQFLLGQDVAVALVAGTLAVIVGTIAAVLAHRDWAPVIGAIVAVLAVGVLGGLALPKRRTVRWGRLVDVVEGVALFALIPLLAIAVGLFGAVGQG